jgi:trans-aconitate methyltransferase
MVASTPDPARHWDDAYAQGARTRSWFQAEPVMSWRMLDAAGVCAGDSVLDVGGGAAPLAGALLARGFSDVTVLDISAAGLQHARRLLGPHAPRVRWIVADVRAWRPQRRYQVWHDRAVFHFLTGRTDQRLYLDTLNAATAAGAVVVIGCFAPDGPGYCSGLPVARYGPRELAAQLGGGWALIAHACEEHITPAGAVQPFTWAAFRQQARGHHGQPPGRGHLDRVTG